MDLVKKEAIKKEAQQHVTTVIPEIQTQILGAKESLVNIRRDLRFKLDAENQSSLRPQAERSEKRIKELEHLADSPYFFRCDIALGDTELRTIYLARFTFPERNIYSWVAPAARIRFEPPGPVDYEVPRKGTRQGILSRKDQFLIAAGTIRFMATESLGSAREMIYQEYLSQRKNSFLLPEIVQQMERAQDTVVRTSHKGPFLIAGPAGSGKTTLALHRVAYLAQSPDTARLFTSDRIIVFVQDARTREYFSGLLPQLGIENVAIVTFAEWAFKHLQLTDFDFVSRYGSSEEEQDEYEHAKYRAVRRTHEMPPAYRRQPYTVLSAVYADVLSTSQKKLWGQQKKEKVLDRFDLTALLLSYTSKEKLVDEQVDYRQLKNGKIVKKIERVPLNYALLVVDEVENYLPEQLRIMHACINADLHAIVYVGDLAQQTHLCTLKDWDSINEQFPEDRKVTLEKVYRSTKQILEYIRGLGYSLQIPGQLREGSPVIEYTANTIAEEVAYIRQHIQPGNESVIGILAKSRGYLVEFQKEFADEQRIHTLTFNEAQGVEFDTVFVVGIDQDHFPSVQYPDKELAREREKVNRDLIYVALTRAMNDLYILGSFPLRELVSKTPSGA